MSLRGPWGSTWSPVVLISKSPVSSTAPTSTHLSQVGSAPGFLEENPNAFEQLGREMPHACPSETRNQSNNQKPHEEP